MHMTWFNRACEFPVFFLKLYRYMIDREVMFEKTYLSSEKARHSTI